jgi:hypothetical protein
LSKRPVAEHPIGVKGACLAAIPSLLVGCASAGPAEGPVRLGQIAFVDGPRVRADHVLEDSRCQVDVQCVSPGRLVVRTTVFGGGWSKRFDLTLGEPVDVADGKLTLVAATQGRSDMRRYRPFRYRFTFTFHGGR